METPAHVRLNGIDLHAALTASGELIRLRCARSDWPGWRLGTRVELRRGRHAVGEWYAVDGLLPVGEELLVVLVPAAGPAREKPYWPKATGAVGS